MSRLDDLIKEKCPNGVEYKTIGDVAKHELGKNKGSKCKNAYSITKGGLVPTDEYFKGAKITSDDISGYRIVKHNWFVYSPSRIDVGSINYLKESFDVIVSPLNVVFSVNEEIILPAFLLYFLNSKTGTWQILNKREGIEGTGRKLLPFEKFAAIKIPLPPLEIQKEIVKQLDTFTELIDMLNSELAIRKGQYEYYRDMLLKFDSTTGGGYRCRVVYKKLAELCLKVPNIKWCNQEEEYRYVDLTSVDKDTHAITNTTIINKTNAPSRAQQIIKYDDVLFGTTRPMLKRTVNIPKEFDNQICSTGYCVLRANQENVKPRYIYHHLNSTNFYIYVQEHQQGTSYPSISDTDVKNYTIPLPPLEIQEKIVNVLDNFDAICSDLKIGLPAEIEARKKQYEYYRDLLLTFAESGDTLRTEQNRTEQNRTEQNRTEQNRTEQMK